MSDIAQLLLERRATLKENRAAIAELDRCTPGKAAHDRHSDGIGEMTRDQEKCLHD